MPRTVPGQPNPASESWWAQWFNLRFGSGTGSAYSRYYSQELANNPNISPQEAAQAYVDIIMVQGLGSGIGQAAGGIGKGIAKIPGAIGGGLSPVGQSTDDWKNL